MKIVWIIGGALAALIAIYVFLLFPRPGAKKKFRPYLGRIYAHRGVFDNQSVPENSLAAFQAAIRLGVGIEFDIHRTADGEVVVFHDATLTRMCGDPRRITDLTLAEVREMTLLGTDEKIPTLREVLDLVRDQVPLVVELKGENADTSLCATAMPILENYGGRYCIESFNPLLVARYRKLSPHVMRGVLVTKFKRDGEDRGALGFVLQNLWLNFLARPDFIAARHVYGRYFPVWLCRKLGAATVAWTIRTREEYDAARGDFDAFIAENVKDFIEVRGSTMLEKMGEFFDRRLDGYEEHQLNCIESAREFYPFTARCLPALDGAVILDLGCGTGLELNHYFPLAPTARVTGIDLAPGMLDALLSKFPERSLNLICASYFEVPLGQSKYDAAVSVESLHHFTRAEKIPLYARVRNALKDGGYFILTDYFALTEEEEHLHRQTLLQMKKEAGIADGEFYHYDTPLTLEHEIDALREAGFSRIEILGKWSATYTIRADK